MRRRISPASAAPRKDRRPQRPARERGGWLSRIAPGVRRLVAKREPPDNLWVKCPDTGEMIYRPDLEAALWVTPAGRHMRIGPDLRFAYTFDGGVHEDIDPPGAPDDPLRFSDSQPYRQRLAAARKATGERDAVSVATGKIRGVPAVVMVQDFAFMGGSLSMAVGEGFIAAARDGAEARRAAGRLHRVGRRAHAGRRAGADADGRAPRWPSSG